MHVQRLFSTTAVALAAVAIAAPVAGARPGPELTPNPASQDAPATAVRTVEVPGPTVVVEADAQGFDWGSAAIGAGVVGGVLLLGAAGGASTRHVRMRPSH